MTPAGTVERSKSCIHCSVSFGALSREPDGRIYSFSCPLCGWVNASSHAVTALTVKIDCKCGQPFTVTLAPNLGPVIEDAGPTALEGAAQIYQRLTLHRTRVKCPHCAADHFVFGIVRGPSVT